MSAAVPGPDGRLRCPWGVGPPDYEAYHDHEWARPVHGEHALYERLTLEAFQSGLSWLTILRKRENFRAAFAGFDPERVARFDDHDRERLMMDAGIVRNAAKINAAITNARAILTIREAYPGGLDALMWSFAPAPRPRPAAMGDVPAASPESKALVKVLKSHGIVFIGPTTAYAAMQACGLVDDHLEGCFVPMVSRLRHDRR